MNEEYNDNEQTLIAEIETFRNGDALRHGSKDYRLSFTAAIHHDLRDLFVDYSMAVVNDIALVRRTRGINLAYNITAINGYQRLSTAINGYQRLSLKL